MNYLNKKLKSALEAHSNYDDNYESIVQVFMFDPDNLVHLFLKLEFDLTSKEEEKFYQNYSQNSLEDLKSFRKIYIELKSKKYNGDKRQFWSLLEKIHKKEISNFKGKYAICISTNILNLERGTPPKEAPKKDNNNNDDDDDDDEDDDDNDKLIETGSDGYLILQHGSFIVVYLEFELSSSEVFKPQIEEDEREFIKNFKINKQDFFKNFNPFYITITDIQLKKDPKTIASDVTDYHYNIISLYSLKTIWYFFIYIILDYIPHMDIGGESFTIKNDENKYLESIFISKKKILDRIFYSKTTGSVDIEYFMKYNWLGLDSSSNSNNTPFYKSMKTMFKYVQNEQTYNYLLEKYVELVRGKETLDNENIFLFIPITSTRDFTTFTGISDNELFIKNPITSITISPIIDSFLKILKSYGGIKTNQNLMLSTITNITKKIIEMFVSYKIDKIVNEEKLYLSNQYCESNFSVHLFDAINEKDKIFFDKFHESAGSEVYSTVHGGEKHLYFEEDIYMTDFIIFVFDNKKQKIASIATFTIVPVKLNQKKGKIYENHDYNKKLYYSGQKILSLNNLFTLNKYGSEKLEKTLTKKDYKRQSDGEKLGMATFSSSIVFNICNLLKDDLNIIGAFTEAKSKGTEIIVSRFGFVDCKNFYIGKEKKSKVDYFHEINRLGKEHDLSIENNLANFTSLKNITTYYKKKDFYQYWVNKMSDRLFILNNSSIESFTFYINKIIESISDLYNEEKEILFNEGITKISDYYYNLADYYQQLFHIRVWEVNVNKPYLILFSNERAYSRFKRELERIGKIVEGCKAKIQKKKYTTIKEDKPKKRMESGNHDSPKAKRAKSSTNYNAGGARTSSGRSPDDGRKATTSWRLCRHDSEIRFTQNMLRGTNYDFGSTFGMLYHDNADIKKLGFTVKCSFCHKKNPKYTEEGNMGANYFCDNECQNKFYK
jgi:hypothetical protein